MRTRLKWALEDEGKAYASASHRNDRQAIFDLLDGNALTVHFQPIFSAKDGSVYGYEALTRIIGENPFNNIEELFQKAILTNTISSFDVRCRENAIRLAATNGINQRDSYLFVNICPEAMMDPSHMAGITDEIAEECGISKDKIILEITEESAIYNYDIFTQAISCYKERGYRIAIDDFGAGHGGLKMLSIIEPDFVKIDRHFISNIDKAIIKSNLVDSISTACHRMGIKVIAEGIETEEELKVVLNMGIDLLQGYYLYRPSPLLNGDGVQIPVLRAKKANCCATANEEQCFIGDIAHEVGPIPPSSDIVFAFNRFINDPELRGLPVVEGERVLGMLHRNRFLENRILGKLGYGFALNTNKTISALMEQQFMMVEANTALEDVAQRILSRKADFLYDDICVTKNGKYFGTIPIYALLDAITEKSLLLAKGSNPLSGLPGNEFIQREIEKKLSQNMHFDVCYVDIDNFKPYNDHYGFGKGDIVIKSIARVLEDNVKSFGDDGFNFVGHIGGDDFIVITRPHLSAPGCAKIISDFEAYLPELHGMEDYKTGTYISKNRKGDKETFGLLSLSIGIVSTEIYKIESYAQLASIAMEVKKAAKAITGSSIVRDRRMMG